MALIILLLAITGASSSYFEYHCGICLCISYDDGCVKADCSNTSTSTRLAHVPNQTCVLMMRDNGLQYVQDGEFQRLGNLTQLDLSSNRINNISKNAFAGLSNLKKLNLSENQLDFDLDKINPEAFKPLQSVTHIDLKENSYQEYPDVHLSKLISLEHLALDGLQDRSFGSGFLLLRNLKALDLAGSSVFQRCNLSTLYMFTFDNVQTLRQLNLSFCSINYIEAGTFSSLQDIDTLDLSHNENLLFDGVENATQGLHTSRLRYLLINKIVPCDAVCVVISKSLVENLQNSSLEIIETNDNRIEIIDVDAMKALPKSLNHISAGNSRFTIGPYLHNLTILSNLTSLDLSGSPVMSPLFQDFSDHSNSDDIHTTKLSKQSCRSPLTPKTTIIDEYEFSPFVDRRKRSLFPSYLKASKENPLKLPEKLKNLRYKFGELFYDLSDLYLAENSLEYIDLSFNILTRWSGPVYGVENVTHLDLSFNFAHFVEKSFFDNFKSLQYLNLSGNRFDMFYYHDFLGILSLRQEYLEILDLSGNYISRLPYHFLVGIPSLKQLHLSKNGITSLDLNYTNNKHLQFINFSDNQIGFISESVRNILDQLSTVNNLSVDISWNPFECTCNPDSLNFLEWLYNTNVVSNHRYLMCINHDKKWWKFKGLKYKYQELKKSCKGYIALSMGLLTLVVLFTSVSLCGVVYRYRWRLIYLYYVGKRHLWKRTDSDIIYDFDAFVSYDDQDIDFVRSLMLPKLEQDQGLHLYIRDRDSLPGAPIAENIIDGIQRSKTSILLISKASLANKWCRYELHMANMEAVSTRRDVMIIVIVEPVLNQDIPPEILYHVQNNSTIQYPRDDQEDEDLFWSSLIEAL